MRIIIEKDYEQMSKTVMDLLLAKMYTNKKMNIAITAGSTPKRLYELLVEEIKNKSDFTNVTYYNFDEIPFKKKGGYGVTMTNLKNMYFDPAGISMEHVHALDEKNYTTHDAYLESVGGLDAIFMGLGKDGHFCGNLPNTTKFGDLTSKVETSIFPRMYDIMKSEVGGNEEDIPDFYVTMGPRSVMNAKETIIFVSGKEKAGIVKEAFFGPVSENVPSSVFQLHPNFTLVLDADAASEIKDLID
ncbi:glucosamine-6-phosphate deaminase [Breznakia pachnodae]|uniref:6-phosphogluconolactonase/glucosamine-6-phosphate isomerase/deaminase n=1 Tax=Breznakia pachnodae TaxID=265178 RepID=A0ABU0DXY9_9FIRM|nr:glucosamine-6-phosphate deaminase [Breznakia pachnodae]MDQ0359506.1 6-phosphogluconolactonase/glucosamine-6-phosphate isomerase/deaminase [Breznakia pachnodae]